MGAAEPSTIQLLTYRKMYSWGNYDVWCPKTYNFIWSGGMTYIKKI